MGIYTEAIQKLYVAYFNRPADYEGLLWWEKAVTAAKGDVSALSAAFAGDKEYKDTYAGMTNLQIVLAVYKNLFNESNPDMAGVDFWVNALNSKAMTIDNVVTQIAAGAQGTHKETYAAKVSAATAFTAALDTPAEASGYIGTAANAAAKAWLSGINKATLEAAIAPAALNATVGTVTNPPVVGQTYNLGKGMDTLVGTSANDTFNAFAFVVTDASTAVETFQAVDTVDGGAGNDTLNITVGAGGQNAGLLGSSSNVETINIDATAGALAGAVAASKFAGATTINQIGQAANVTGLAATTTAGFNGITAGALNVAAASAATTATVALTNVEDDVSLTVSGAALTGAIVSGKVVDGNTDANTTADSIALTVTAGKDVQAITLNAGVAATLTVGNAAGSTKFVNSVDASASTAGVTYNAAAAVTTIKGGTAADTLTINTATVAAATGVTAVTAVVEGGAGGDTINVATTGDGLTNVDAGAGDDTVNIVARGTGKLTVNLGDGADSFTAGVAVGAADAIDAGAGTDTLLLSLVGSANIGAFSNFEGFDAVGLGKTLDVDILATKNTVTEFVASGNVGAAAPLNPAGATLTNVGAGVGVRVTGSMTGSILEVNQKTAGALTVTVDADEAGKGNDGAELPVASIKTNATSVKAVFDTAYVADTAAEKLLAFNADNYTALSLDVASATAVEVVSGGTNATNALTLTNGAKVAAVTVSGAQALHFVSAAGAAKLTSIDASAATGGLRASTDLMADGGAIKLGTGVDIITVGAGSTTAAMESLVGFEKTAAAAVGTDATAAAAAQADADVLSFGAAGTVAGDITVAGGKAAKGVLTFTGAGPADLAAAIAIADLAADGVGEVVVFEYLGNSYVFQQGVADLVVKLTGITGVTQVGEVGATDTFFLV